MGGKRVDFFSFFVLEDGAVEIQKYLFEMVKKEWKMRRSSGKMSVTPSGKKDKEEEEEKRFGSALNSYQCVIMICIFGFLISSVDEC